MPNGGVLPSCLVCKWAKRNESGDPIDPIECQQHGFVVWLANVHVCSNLTGSNDEPGLESFVQKENLGSEFMYAWFQFSYRMPESPTLPLYHHELINLASLQEFSKWSLDDQAKMFRKRQEERKNELLDVDHDEE